MSDLRKQIDAVLKGKDMKYSKPKDKVKEKDETYKDMYRESFEQKDYPNDYEDDEGSEGAEFDFPGEEEAEKNHPDYKQDVALIRMMINKKFKEKLAELKGK